MLKVPTKLEVEANFEEYQALSNKLIKLLNEIEVERRLADNKNILQDLLDTYAKSHNLLIIFAYITEENYNKKEKTRKLIYYDPENNVYIYYFSRRTTYLNFSAKAEKSKSKDLDLNFSTKTEKSKSKDLNETDIFTDFSIIIDGKVIVKLEYQ